MAVVRRTASRDRWGTIPRDDAASSAGVSVCSTVVPSPRSMVILPVRGASLPSSTGPSKAKRELEAIVACARETIYSTWVREGSARRICCRMAAEKEVCRVQVGGGRGSREDLKEEGDRRPYTRATSTRGALPVAERTRSATRTASMTARNSSGSTGLFYSHHTLFSSCAAWWYPSRLRCIISKLSRPVTVLTVSTDR